MIWLLKIGFVSKVMTDPQIGVKSYDRPQMARSETAESTKVSSLNSKRESGERSEVVVAAS